MKKFKKIMAVLVAAVLMVAMMAPAWAATITINQKDETGTEGAETYSLYKIFDVKKTAGQASYNEDDAHLGPGTENGLAYTISTSSPWYTIINGGGAEQVWVTLTPTIGNPNVCNVEWKDASPNTAAGARAFAKWLEKKKDNTVGSPIEIVSDGTTATTTTVDDGYYLIESSLGTELILATSNLTLTTKNSYPTSTKTQEHDHYAVGDFVKYTIVVTLPATTDWTKSVTVHDTINSALVPVTTASVAANDHGYTAKVSVAGDFTEKVTMSSQTDNHDGSGHTVANGNSGYDFVLDISTLAPAANAEPVAKTITIEYYAELRTAALADTNLTNTEFVEYSEYKTNPSAVNLKTYDFDLQKLFTGSTTDPLLSATFKLYPKVGENKGTEAIKFIDGGTLANKNKTYVKGDSVSAAGNSESDVITVEFKNGVAQTTNVRGLDTGTYYLTEQTTSDGYKLLTNDVVIVIADDGTVTYSGAGVATETVNGALTAQITNTPGKELPSTGGMGTTVLYIVGGMLIVLAGAYLFFSRKKTA